MKFINKDGTELFSGELVAPMVREPVLADDGTCLCTKWTIMVAVVEPPAAVVVSNRWDTGAP